nr:SAM-dependent methyltransferase [Oceanusvirus sp.]
MKRVLEVGAAQGYSARNFLAAVDPFPGSVVVSIDKRQVPIKGNKHASVVDRVERVSAEQVAAKIPGDNKVLDLVFFDAHRLTQMDLFRKLKDAGMITDRTVVALHDTNFHYAKHVPTAREVSKGVFVHQEAERVIAQTLKDEFGYDLVSARTDREDHDKTLPFRHGLTVCQKHAPFSRATE